MYLTDERWKEFTGNLIDMIHDLKFENGELIDEIKELKEQLAKLASENKE